jgi:hypothetical protein
MNRHCPAYAPIPLFASLLLVTSLALPACGGDDGGEDELVGDTSGDPSTGDGDGDPTTGDGDGDPTTGDGDGDPSTGDGDGDPSTGDGDGDPTTGDGDGDPTTGDGDGDGDPFDDATYTLTIMPGGLDRLVIRRVSNSEPSCTHMVLVWPSFDTFDIDMPDGWAVESAMVWRQGFCPMDLSDPDGIPMSGTGTISVAAWDALMTYPCALNFDLEINNATDPPSTSVWKKNAVPVGGVNCG